MTLRLPDRYRAQASQWLLSHAGKFPVSKKTSEDLTTIGELEKQSALAHADRARLPEGSDFCLHDIYLFDAFTTEDFDHLAHSLDRLFDHRRSSGKDVAEFRDQLHTTRGQSFGSLGTIFRDKKAWLRLGAWTEWPDLPPEVDAIQVGYLKILPSLVIVYYAIQLSSDVTDQVRSIQVQPHLSEITFSNLLPWTDKQGYSVLANQFSRRKAARSPLVHVQQECESLLLRRLRGLLSKPRSDQESGELPSLLVLSMTGIPDGYWDHKDWLTKAHAFLDDLSITPSARSYTSSEAILDFSSELSRKNRRRYTFLLREEAFSKDDRPGSSNKSAAQAMHEKLPFLVHDLLVFLGPQEVLNSIASSTEQLRRSTATMYRSPLKRLMSLFFGNVLRHGAKVQRHALVAERISDEIDAHESWLRHDLGDLKNYRASGFFDERSKMRTLDQDAIEALRFNLANVQRHVRTIRGELADYVGIRNMVAMYRLQVYTVLLAIIAVAAAIMFGWLSLPGHYAPGPGSQHEQRR